MKRLIFAIPFLSLAACTPNIIDRDFEKEEVEYVRQHGEQAKDPQWMAPTDTIVQAGKADGIIVTLYRGVDVKLGDNKLQKWHALLRNNNDTDKCVQVAWKLMEFDMVTEYTDYTLVPKNSVLYDYAIMTQKVWNIDGLQLVLPASGYAAAIDVKDLTDKGDCVFETEVEEK